MSTRLQDRVISNRLEKFRKIFNLFAAIAAVAAVLVTIWIVVDPFLKTARFWMDYAMLLAMPLLFTIAIRVIAKNGKSPYIEWWGNRIVYKATEAEERTTIFLDAIDSISFAKEHVVNIFLKDNHTYYLNLAGFNEIQLARIKRNFEKLNMPQRSAESQLPNIVLQDQA